MKLSEQLGHDFRPDPKYPYRNFEMSWDYLVDLIVSIHQLELENNELKARLRGISQRAEDLQQAAIDMETVLNKFRTGG